ncbi:phenylalanine--tRNA ligase subunit beta [Cryobacterium sp. BB736]|uniref:phenylalanine--tRNA ligase subunit beta n=1 Tax=Cryobacterium sp. BB736 TaxID=2746963 RepID=UPI001876EAE8|nr:phenylalanine--tRNA ligase subunit beta [Cryobacterium sp. BB736]
MRVPISWLREYVDVPEDISAEGLQAALVKVGLEEESAYGFDVTGPVVVGQVLEYVDEPQSNGKTIRWCQVDVGDGEPRGIVCGAHNFHAGDKVVVSLPGAVLPGPFPISARKTYGHVSDGMIASVRELGIGEDHDGILRLAELGLDPEPGTDAISLLGLDDWAVEVNVTTDRGYALSIRGIAREYSHATGAAFRDPARHQPADDARTAVEESPVPVSIDDRSPIRGRVGCSIFVTRVVRDVDPSRPTPAWMVARLALAGIRSISLLVDITNYVMVELGQPIHGYDLDKLTGGITVRRATPGEKLTTLDDKERTLSPEDLLITDDSGPIGLAGVMGGATTEISDSTTNVLIEAASFDSVSIARTARRHKLPSEASRRFERGVDPAVAEPAAARVAQLLVELAGGTDTGAVYRVGEVPERESIFLPQGYVNGIIGADFADGEILNALTQIGAAVQPVDGGLTVTPPTWRPDLLDQADLAEEAARIVGYDRIPSALPVAPPGRGLTREQRLRRAAANTLAAAGLTEVLAYPFVTTAANATFGTPDGSPAHAFTLVNPLDPTSPELRTSLVPGLIDIARRNLSRGFVDLRIFEAGVVYLRDPERRYGLATIPSGTAKPSDDELAALAEQIPQQPLRIGALFVGNTIERQPGQGAVPAGLSDALDAAHQVAFAVGAELRIRQGSHAALHPGRTAELLVDETRVGFAGELLPALAEEHDLPRVVAVVELDLGALIDLAPREVVPTPISGYPAATQDVSLVVDQAVPADDVLTALIDGAGELLEQAHLVDDYRGTGLPDGAKSLTFALRFRAPDRTLTAAEATESKLAGVAVAAERHGASLRD